MGPPPPPPPPPGPPLPAGSPTLAAPLKDKSDLEAAVAGLDRAEAATLMLKAFKMAKWKSLKEAFPNANGTLDMLTQFLKQIEHEVEPPHMRVDLANAVPRDVSDADWSTVSAIQRSDGGSVGIFFIATATGVVVAKSMTKADFRTQSILNDLASALKINHPKMRLIEKGEPEYDTLADAVKQIFTPLHLDLWEVGGARDALFTGEGILLQELVKGRPLCHRGEGQRPLVEADFEGLGRLFVYDLLIRNTDRFPSRRTIPRPIEGRIDMAGNPGNVMLGAKGGEVTAIDNELQIMKDPEEQAVYRQAVKSVVDEITGREYATGQGLVSQWLMPLPSFKGVLSVSVNDLTNWSELSPTDKKGLDILLQMMRLSAEVLGYPPPPADADELKWRKWANQTLPRTVHEVLKFVSAVTGYDTPKEAKEAFRRGFVSGLAAASTFVESMNKDVLGFSANSATVFREALNEEKASEVLFVLSLIKDVTEQAQGDICRTPSVRWGKVRKASLAPTPEKSLW
ncbi:unnamed protein product [Chrysoparadoxa australica]